MIIYTGYLSDDAFITYRYVKNIAEGNGWTYNSGEKVQGNSSPLYTIMLVPIFYFFGDKFVPFFSQWFYILFNSITIYILWKLMFNFHHLSRFITILLFVGYPKTILIGISGMEATMVIMLMVLSFYLIIFHRYYWGFFFLGLLLLARIDTFIWIFVCVSVLIIFKNKIPFNAFVILIATYTIWIVFSIFYFGTWIPHSIIAKNVSWNHLFPSFDPVRIGIGYFPFQGLGDISFLIKSIILAIFLIPIILGMIRLILAKSNFVIFPIFFLLYNLFFASGKVIMTDWYYLPGYLAYFITLGVVLDWFFEKNNFSLVSTKVISISKFCIVGLFTVLIIIGGIRWADNPGGLFERQNKRIGIWLRQNAKVNSTVLVEPIGFIGWESNLYIHDYIGLVSPDIIQYRKMTPKSNKWFINYIKDKQPDYIVLRSWEIPNYELFHGHGDGLFFNQDDKYWFEKKYQIVNLNYSKSQVDDIYLVLYEKSL